MSDYEHLIRGADAHSPKASEPPESQFLRSSGEMDPYQGDGDEYMTTRFQSFQDPLQQYQHPDSASQPQASHPYRITDGSGLVNASCHVPSGRGMDATSRRV